MNFNLLKGSQFKLESGFEEIFLAKIKEKEG